MISKIIKRVAAKHQVRISDKAPSQRIINQAKKDSRITIDLKTIRAIYLRDSKLEIGCVHPFQDGEWWRLGSIFILPEHRQQGYGEAAISNFFQGKKGLAFIDYENEVSRIAYEAAGFSLWEDVPDSGGAWYSNNNEG